MYHMMYEAVLLLRELNIVMQQVGQGLPITLGSLAQEKGLSLNLSALAS